MIFCQICIIKNFETYTYMNKYKKGSTDLRELIIDARINGES